MALDKDRLLKLAVTAILLPTLALAKLPTVAVPDKVAVSLPNRPPAIADVPVKVALVVVSYTLLAAFKPLMVTGAAVILAVNGLVTPEMK